MRFFIDTEFEERPDYLKLISIAIVAEDGQEWYAENRHWPGVDVFGRPLSIDPWLVENVVPHLTTADHRLRPDKIAEGIAKFINRYEGPHEFWGYFPAYDWVLFCWLFGRMIDLPKEWPHQMNDLRQAVLAIYGNLGPLKMSKPEKEHHALFDARWIREQWLRLVNDAATQEHRAARALLRTILDVVDDPSFGDDHTGVVNWLGNFAEAIRTVLDRPRA